MITSTSNNNNTQQYTHYHTNNHTNNQSTDESMKSIITDNATTQLGFNMLLHNISYQYCNHNHNNDINNTPPLNKALPSTHILYKRNRSQSDVGLERHEYNTRHMQHNTNRYVQNHEIINNINLAIDADNIYNNQSTHNIVMNDSMQPQKDLLHDNNNCSAMRYTSGDTPLYSNQHISLYDSKIQLELARLSVRSSVNAKQKLHDINAIDSHTLHNPVIKRLCTEQLSQPTRMPSNINNNTQLYPTRSTSSLGNTLPRSSSSRRTTATIAALQSINNNIQHIIEE